jgi:hypothetical protein
MGLGGEEMNSIQHGPDGVKIYDHLLKQTIFSGIAFSTLPTKVATEKAINQLNNFHCRHICGDDGAVAIPSSPPPPLLLVCRYGTLGVC